MLHKGQEPIREWHRQTKSLPLADIRRRTECFWGNPVESPSQAGSLFCLFVASFFFDSVRQDPGKKPCIPAHQFRYHYVILCRTPFKLARAKESLGGFERSASPCYECTYGDRCIARNCRQPLRAESSPQLIATLS